MIFTSFSFIVFFALVFAVYWLMPDWRSGLRFMGLRVALSRKEARLALLLLASAAFYGWWDWRFLALIGACIGAAYVAGLGAAPLAGRSKGSRLVWLWLGIGVNLGLLGFFKYFNFFVDNAIRLVAAIGLEPHEATLRIMLPVGVSFYVFQAISYAVDVYRGHVGAERRLSRVALYVAFFPQLVAGPIVRAASFLPQMEREKRWAPRRLAAAARSFAVGFIYKALIADNLAPIADPVFADMAQHSNAAVAGASLVFAVQMYFDFAGYSLMAVGTGCAFGYHLPRNFAFPFTAASTTEYWRRWHISLSTWLRDYLFIPLGGSRGSTLFYYRNLFITMFLGGLWHGAAWTFVLWGTLQALALIVHKVWGRYVERPLRLAQRLPMAAYWIFGLALTQLFVVQQRGLFRSESTEDGLSVFAAFAGLRQGGPQEITWAVWLVPLLVVIDAVIGRRRRLGLDLRPLSAAAAARPGAFWGLAGAATALALSLYPLEAAPFVYFQF